MPGQAGLTWRRRWRPAAMKPGIRRAPNRPAAMKPATHPYARYLPDPALHRAYFFAPLILTEITSLSLVTLSPKAGLPKATSVSSALMLAVLAVFAIWSMSGSGYPTSPAPITLNVISRILAFATILTLFLPQRARRTGYGADDSDELAGAGSGLPTGGPELAVAPLQAATPK